MLLPRASGYLFSVAEAVKHLGRPIAFYPAIAKAIGIKECLILCQLLYWTPRVKNAKGEGWIYKSAEEIEEETTLTYKEQIRARKRMEEHGLIKSYYDRSEHRNHFRVVPKKLDELMGGCDKTGDTQPVGNSGEHMTKCHVPPAKTSDGTCQNVSSLKKTETTSETTQENPGRSVDINRRAAKIPNEIAEEAIGAVDLALNNRLHCGDGAENTPNLVEPSVAKDLLAKCWQRDPSIDPNTIVAQVCKYVAEIRIPSRVVNQVGWILTEVPKSFASPVRCGRELAEALRRERFGQPP